MLLVPRRFRVLVGTIDYTDCIMSYDGGDEKLGYSGLVIFRGKIVVGRALGFETLDDRKVKRWNRGTPVKIDITDVLFSRFDVMTRRAGGGAPPEFARLPGDAWRRGFAISRQSVHPPETPAP